MLKTVGTVLEKGIRVGDWAFSPYALRLGGDEFLVIFSLSSSDHQETGIAIMNRLSRLISQIQTPLGQLDVAFGGAFLREGESLNEILGRVDRLMYLSKREGGPRLD